VKIFSKVAVSGLLWLGFSAVMFGDTLTLSQTYNINDGSTDGGGQFMGLLNGTDPVTVYCIDFLNELTSPDNVTVSTLANLSDTRYGNTPTSTFTFFDGSSASDSLYTGSLPLTGAQLTLDPEERYLLAAYLTTLYNLAPSPTPAISGMDSAIQGAIWDLLDTTTTTFVSNSEATFITQALVWLNTPADAAAVATLTSEVRIYSPDVLSGPGNSQEMIGLVATPEPETLAMLGAGLGLVGIGLIRKRRSA
jgi:hypothetical protein